MHHLAGQPNVVQVIHTCHIMGVHRDLKAANFLLQRKSNDSPLQATDFGPSAFFKPGDIFKDIVGSAYYVAPKVLHRHYGPEADIWSAGVIRYILLSGVPPFWAHTQHDIFDAILTIDLVKNMLRHDPQESLTAAAVLSHPWIRIDGEASDKPLDNAILGGMKHLSEEELMGLKQMFKSMDTDNNGLITFEEMNIGLATQGSKLAEDRQLMDVVDVDGNGTIDYMQFSNDHHDHTDYGASLVIATSLSEEELMGLKQMFKSMDTDNSGSITFEELNIGLAMQGSKLAEDRQLMDVADVDGNGTIDYMEFSNDHDHHTDYGAALVMLVR
ncbi:hypothetical protein KP509_37G031800 [Ceratopteris richardii]|uniref:Uncharacterized protein n=1 Tax=Ceratopteris richardii TaxID=49495 RepID=A0A8T2Q6U1_CERRI|nr:hypothetical protein KP509_37G031800 [Ceratopteris richardii]